MTVTNVASLAAVVQTAVQAKIEENLRSKMVWLTPETFVPAIYSNGTSSMTFQSFADIAANGQTLAEGVPPTPDSMAQDSETLTPVQMGHTVEITDRAELFSPAALVSTAVERLAFNAAAELQLVAQKAADACTQIYYANGTTNSAVTATGSANIFRLMYARLQALNVPTFSDGLYRAIVSPRVAFDVQNDSASAGSWVSTMQYADPNALISNEIGSAFGFRFLSTDIVTSATTAGSGGKDVVNSYFFGPSVLAVGDLGTLKATFVGFTPDKTDPLGQLAFAGWKAMYGARLLTKAGCRMVILRSTATILNAATDH
jgi:N4-gp56 family major capsid protein